MLTRGAQGVAALVGVLLVARTVDRATQGFYFAILGFLAFMQLAEFGLTYAVMQSASHESAIAINVRQPAPPDTLARLGALLRGATRFNAGVTVISALAIAAIGSRMLLAGGSSSNSVPQWMAPWASALVAASATQLLNPRISLLEGAGHVGEVWRLRFVQESAAAVVLWSALLGSLALWSIALSYATRVAIGAIWLGRGWPRDYFSRLTRAHANAPGNSYWWTEVWPFQWRIGVSALSGYMIFQFFTPLIFAIKGPAVAGQFGMTLAITNGLLTATTAWLTSQAPFFGQLIATRSFNQLDRAFVRSLRSSFLLVVVAGSSLCGIVVAMDRLDYSLGARLLSPAPFALFVAATVVNHVIFAMAIYLRAHRREPLVATSALGAIVTPLIVAYVGRQAGVGAIAASYLAITCLGLFVTTAIFVSRSRAWHVDSTNTAR
jgi:hypothetical protein